MKKLLFIFLFLGVVAGAITYLRLTISPPSPGDSGEFAQPSARAKVETEEDKTRRKLLGSWQDDYQGKRTMTLNEDGTGTMLVELGGLQAMLFAARLRFDMKWELDGKKLVKKTVGGEPADKVNLILNTMGNTAADTLLELTDDRLLLLDKDGKTQYDWRRLTITQPKVPPTQ